MKRVRLTTASYGGDSVQLSIEAPLVYKDYIIDVAFYNDDNSKSRVNSLHPRLKAKIPKMMEWHRCPGYDYYIWIDSKFIILEGFLENMFRFESDHSDLYVFRHGFRSSVKEELEYMNNKMSNGSDYLNQRYGGELMNDQVRSYLSDPDYIDQLFYGGCFMYTKNLVKNPDFNLMTDWMLHNVIYSVQDQLSLPYLIHKHKVNYTVYPYDLMSNNFLGYDYIL